MITEWCKLGTRMWLDSVAPELIDQYIPLGVTGATSNPLIISGLVQSGHFDEKIVALANQESDPEKCGWLLTNAIITDAEAKFRSVFDRTQGDDGYVSFELDPLLEDNALYPSQDQKVAEYIRLGKLYSENHPNRMIKVPATAAGLQSLEELAFAGVPLNVTLIFTMAQYRQAREAIFAGAMRASRLSTLKSVYSVFVSRVDSYAGSALALSAAAQDVFGLVNCKRIWKDNEDFWASNKTPLKQEIVFASTGVKNAGWEDQYYVKQLVGSGIQTNPPALLASMAQSTVGGLSKNVGSLPAPAIVDECTDHVDWVALEETLVEEGVAKFIQPQRDLIALLKQRVSQLAASDK